MWSLVRRTLWTASPVEFIFLPDYPWNKLISPVVDIGGGIGSLEMVLMKDEQNSSLEFTIFDIPTTTENARKVSLEQRS
jgi:hypothetical protein